MLFTPLPEKENIHEIPMFWSMVRNSSTITSSGLSITAKNADSYRFTYDGGTVVSFFHIDLINQILLLKMTIVIHINGQFNKG
jgi:hypothetical protein